MGNAGSGIDSDQSEEHQATPGKDEVDTSLLPTEFTSKYEVVSKIGRGSFGSVYKVRDIKTKAIYAAKQVELNESNLQEVSCMKLATSGRGGSLASPMFILLHASPVESTVHSAVLLGSDKI